MDRVALDLGFLQIYWYSVFIFLGIITSCIVIYKESKINNINEEFLINLIFNSLLFGIIGARLYYVLFNIPYYLSNPIEIFQIWNGGLAIHGGILAGLLTTIIYTKSNKVSTVKMLDIIVVGLIIGQAIGRWGNFFNGEAYGNITTLAALQKQGIPKFIIDGMYIMGSYRQPTFLYESVWNIFGFIILIVIRRLREIKIGQLLGFYLIWYGLARFIIEGLRTDSLMLGPLKIAKLVSMIFIFAGIYFVFLYNRKNKVPYNRYNKKVGGYYE